MEEDFDFEDKEVEEVIDNDKHWKSLGIASAVISVISIAILSAIVLLTPDADANAKLEPYSLADAITRRLIKGHHFNGTWVSEHEFIYQSGNGNILLHDCKRGSSRAITNRLNTTNGEVVHFSMSTARTYLLLGTRRRNAPASSEDPLECNPLLEYYVYDLRNGNIINLRDEFLRIARANNKQASGRSKSGSNRSQSESASRCPVQTAQWTPLGNVMLLLHHNDIYRLNLDQYDIDQLTLDGSPDDSIFNGFNDYLYREFIFSQPTSIWWSHGTSRRRYLCWLRLDNSGVPLATVSRYDLDNTRPDRLVYRHPTINSSIGDASLWIMEVDNSGRPVLGRAAVRVQPPERLSGQESYVTYVDWTDSDQLVVLWTWRHQRRSLLALCQATQNWHCRELVTLSNWLQLRHVARSVMSASQLSRWNSTTISNALSGEYFLCGQIPETGVKTFYQLYSFNVNTKVINSYLNIAERGEDQQRYQIIELLGYNERSKLIFFVGQSLSQSNSDIVIAEQDMRLNVFVFVVEHGTVHCLTCQLVKCHRIRPKHSPPSPGNICIDPARLASSEEKDRDEESCIFKRVNLSPTGHYAMFTCLVGVMPRVYMVEFADLANYSRSNLVDLVQNIRVFEDNGELDSRIEAKIIPNVESFIITREHNSLTKYLRIKILTSYDFNNEDIAKYPFVFEMYPPQHVFLEVPRQDGEYLAADYPDTEWAVHLVTEHNFVYGWLDGQFSEDNNQSLHEASFDELVDDYVAVIEFIQSNMSFVNLAQSCLVGKNVGASLVLHALSSPSTGIECGIANAPVVHWSTTNTVLAEQYIDWKRIRANDYAYSLKVNLNHKTLAEKQILFIHGTANQLFPIWHTLSLLKSLTLDAESRFVKESESGSNTSVASSEHTEGQLEAGNLTNHHLLELLVDQGNSIDAVREYYYRKLEFFLFHFVVA